MEVDCNCVQEVEVERVQEVEVDCNCVQEVEVERVQEVEVDCNCVQEVEIERVQEGELERVVQEMEVEAECGTLVVYSYIASCTRHYFLNGHACMITLFELYRTYICMHPQTSYTREWVYWI